MDLHPVAATHNNNRLLAIISKGGHAGTMPPLKWCSALRYREYHIDKIMANRVALEFRSGRERKGVIKSYECQWWGPSSSTRRVVRCSHQHHPLVNLWPHRVVVVLALVQDQVGPRRQRGRNTWLTCWFSKWTFYANAFYVLHTNVLRTSARTMESSLLLPARSATELLFTEQIYPFPAMNCAEVRILPAIQSSRTLKTTPLYPLLVYVCIMCVPMGLGIQIRALGWWPLRRLNWWNRLSITRRTVSSHSYVHS